MFCFISFYFSSFLERDLGYKKPGRWDFLPFVLFRSTKRFVFSVPDRIRDIKEKKREKEEKRKQEEQEAREAAERGQ